MRRVNLVNPYAKRNEAIGEFASCAALGKGGIDRGHANATHGERPDPVGASVAVGVELLVFVWLSRVI